MHNLQDTFDSWQGVTSKCLQYQHNTGLRLHVLFILYRLGSLSKTFDLQPLCCLEELRQLILSNIHFPSIHELQNCCQMLKWNILEDDDWMLGRILFEQSFEIWTASR